MPWKVINPMDLKMQLVKDWKNNDMSVTELAIKHNVTRPTVYKWLGRYEKLGVSGLNEKSRAPINSPLKTSSEILKLLVDEKLKFSKRGPRKIRAKLKRIHPDLKLPAISTIAYWFKKQGLVEKKRRRLRVPAYTQPFSKCEKPNDIWSMDYKGQFFMRNNRVCYPLTVTDNHSRFILAADAFPGPRYGLTRESFERIFREYGLPDAIRSDNGTPFAGRCIGGLSRLSVWFILLGITPQRIAKGHPEQNGRHERMHKSLKKDVLDVVASNLCDQQRVFDNYRYEFNHDRPHESLDDKTPSEFYKRSDRTYIKNPKPPEYSHQHLVRRVSHCGDVKFKGRRFFLSESLGGQPVGLKEIADGLWQLQFSFYNLGSVDLRKNQLIRT